MRSIAGNYISEYQIQKSKFITYLFFVTSIEEVNQNLSIVREQHPDATHHCYAYIVDTLKRCSDDGEPSGTAGMPILNVLEKQNLNFVLCIVVRYFGGILLGAGGLVRAYTNSVTQALSEITYTDIVLGKEIKLEFTYDNKQMIDSILKNSNLIQAEYQEKIEYCISINNTEWEHIKEQLLPYLLTFEIVKEDCYLKTM